MVYMRTKSCKSIGVDLHNLIESQRALRRLAGTVEIERRWHNNIIFTRSDDPIELWLEPGISSRFAFLDSKKKKKLTSPGNDEQLG